MKPYAFTALLALILGGMGAYIYFVEIPKERTRLQQKEEAARLLPFDEAAITALAVRTGDTEVVMESDRSGQWTITAPVHAEADSREVRSVIRALVLGRVSRVLATEPKDLAPFGLDEPSVVLTVTADSQREVLSIGDSGPITATVYAMRDSDRKILLTTLAPKNFFNKTVMTFRRKEILTFEPSKVERMRLTYASRQFVLYRVREKGKDNKESKGKWTLRSPIEADADTTEVRAILFRLQKMKALGFVDAGPEYQRTRKALTAPSAKITLHIQGADKTVEVFEPDPGSGEAFAVTGNRHVIYRIDPSIIGDLTKDLFGLRDKRLLGIELDNLALLEVKTRSTHYVLVNQHGDWVLEDQPEKTLNKEIVNLFVSRVVNLPAELQVLKRAGPLAPYGLASPAATFTATDRKGRTARLALGKRTSGLVYARSAALPGLYQARADILDQVPQASQLPSTTE